MDKEIVEYKIIVSTNIDAVEKLVSDGLKLGWFPLGGLSIQANGNAYQAIVRYK